MDPEIFSSTTLGEAIVACLKPFWSLPTFSLTVSLVRPVLFCFIFLSFAATSTFDSLSLFFIYRFLLFLWFFFPVLFALFETYWVCHFYVFHRANDVDSLFRYVQMLSALKFLFLPISWYFWLIPSGYRFVIIRFYRRVPIVRLFSICNFFCPFIFFNNFVLLILWFLRVVFLVL